MSRTGILPGLALVVVLALQHAAVCARPLSPVDTPGPPPSLDLKDIDGNAARLADYRGRVVLINFWATWCPPCVAEMPSMQAMQDHYDGQVVVLAVSNQESLRRVAAFKRRLRLDFRFLLDTDGATSRRWGVNLLPSSFLLDREGRLRYSVRGEVDWNDAPVREVIDRLLPAASSRALAVHGRQARSR